jgi:hypothetical protein
MSYKKPLTTFLLVSLLFFSTLSAGCPGKAKEVKNQKEISFFSKKDTSSLYEKVLKERQLNARNTRGKSMIKDEKTRQRYLAVSEACNKAYSSCANKCDTNKCEESCLDALSNCEKNIPLELRTLK